MDKNNLPTILGRAFEDGEAFNILRTVSMKEDFADSKIGRCHFVNELRNNDWLNGEEYVFWITVAELN